MRACACDILCEWRDVCKYVGYTKHRQHPVQCLLGIQTPINCVHATVVGVHCSAQNSRVACTHTGTRRRLNSVAAVHGIIYGSSNWRGTYLALVSTHKLYYYNIFAHKPHSHAACTRPAHYSNAACMCVLCKLAAVNVGCVCEIITNNYDVCVEQRVCTH